MRKICFACAALAAALVISSPVEAQKKRLSPHETISAEIGDNKITLTYGRPYSKNPKSGETRKIWGGLVPYGKAWRTGADEATTLVLQKAIMIGDTTIPAGTYTLYTVPMDNGTAKLAFSKKTGQWGIPVNETEDLTRVDLKKDPLDKQVDQFTMAIDKTGTGGVIKMMWENTQYSVAFTNAKK